MHSCPLHSTFKNLPTNQPLSCGIILKVSIWLCFLMGHFTQQCTASVKKKINQYPPKRSLTSSTPPRSTSSTSRSTSPTLLLLLLLPVHLFGLCNFDFALKTNRILADVLSSEHKTSFLFKQVSIHNVIQWIYLPRPYLMVSAL